MGWTQIVFGTVLVVVLLFVAILYAVRQIVALRRLRASEEMPPEERAYLLGRARRRFVASILMFLLGIMLATALVCLEEPAERLAQERAEQERQGDRTPLSDEQRFFARLYTVFWIAFLLILMIVVFLAALDFWATRRFGLGQQRQISTDRRAMIEREVSRLRQERNGHS